MILDLVESAPNPQFTRQRMVDLTGTWQFAHDDADRGLREGWFAPDHVLEREILVPFPPESPASGIHDTGFHPVIWYRREFRDPRGDRGEHLLLRFGAVDYKATVWVNGRYVGSHEGGMSPFALDVTQALDGDASAQVVTVRVEDDPEDLEQPRGKQDWRESPAGIHYNRTSGIWQPVWFEVVPEIRIDSVRWGFDRANWTASFEIALSRRARPGTRLVVELEHEDEIIAAATCSIHGRFARGLLDVRSSVNVLDQQALLWSPERPTLLGARLTLTSPSQPDDEVLTYTGLRTITVDGRKIRLNDIELYQRLVLNQGYWPESHLAAPSGKALKREVEMILTLGFNGARNHQKAEDPRFLFWADRLGLLLWGEMANAFAYTDRSIDRQIREWRELVIRDRNHPSIIAWVPFNESWGVDDVGLSANQQHAVKSAYHATHQLDGSRPVVGNDGWENVIGDILTIHDYAWDPDLLEYRYGSDSTPADMVDRYELGHRRLIVGDYEIADKPVILSEYGGVSYAPAKGETWFGYGMVQTPEEFLEKYRELTNVVSESRQLAGFCYTQLTDTMQEINGLLTEDREPKVDIDEIRRITIGRHAPRKRPSAE